MQLLDSFSEPRRSMPRFGLSREWLRLSLLAFVLVCCGESSERTSRPASPSSTGRACETDSDCLPDQFCDRTVCQFASGQASYGEACGDVIFSQYAVPQTFYDPCSGFLCLDGRCRSCVSARECYESVGHLGCYPSSRPPGLRCGDSPPEGYELYTPTGPFVEKQGRTVAAVDGTCSVDRLRFVIDGASRENAPDARLAVVWWHQRAGEFDEFARIAYDEPLNLTTSLVEIPFIDVDLPAEENLVCWRHCRDPAACDCEGPPSFALGSVILALDRNEDGALSLDEIRREQIGLVDAFIGWSPVRTEAASIRWSEIQGPLELGFCVYPVQTQLAAVTDATTAFGLSSCPANDTSCSLPVWRIFCHTDCDKDWGLNRLGL
jgi:hypothetical protein